jgi:hypothetical protein
MNMPLNPDIIYRTLWIFFHKQYKALQYIPDFLGGLQIFRLSIAVNLVSRFVFKSFPVFLSGSIRNYGDVLAMIFFHHRDTGDTEDIFHFAPPAFRRHDGQKNGTFGDISTAIRTKIFFMLPH